MPRSTGHTYDGRAEQSRIFKVLADSLQSRDGLAVEVRETLPEALRALKDLAFGHYYQQTAIAHDGTVITDYYKKGPNFNGLKLWLSLCNYDTESNANAALATVRAVSGLTQQNLMRTQELQSKAVAAKTRRELKAMDQSYATEEQFTEMGIALSAALLNFIQATPVTELPRTEAAKQKWLERLTKRINDTMAELLNVDRKGDEDE